MNFFLHGVSKGSSVHVYLVVHPHQNPELVARLEKIRARAEQKEYNRMVGNVDPNVSVGASLYPTKSMPRAYEQLKLSDMISFSYHQI